MAQASMATAARAILLAASLAGVAAPIALIVGPALPGHRVEPWVSKQPQNLAFVTGFHCKLAADRQRDFGTPIPPECANSRWNPINNPPPPNDAPPLDDAHDAPAPASP
jgi:hypothetical protein